MKAVGYYQSLPIERTDSLLDLDLPDPVPGPHDLLVEVKAISVNPIDVKVRRNTNPPSGEPKVLGWDASGVVRAAGGETRLFKPDDRVWYAGTLFRPGTDSELHLVDERIVGPMPASLDFARAAALPLTSIAAWELLFDRLEVPEAPGADPGSAGALLIIGAAGGVGSILVQLARRLTGLTVIGTASRPETRAWVAELGAHHVIDHTRPIAARLADAGVPEVQYVVSLNQTHLHFAEIAKAIAPQGRFALIDDPELFDFRQLKRKSVSLHWELMFTRSIFRTADMQRQHEILERVAGLIDAGTIRTTFAEHFGTVDAANLKRAHAAIEANRTIGKIVLEGF